MEHLNKQQIILLALLVAFITATATGIVTVSLLDQPSGNENPGVVNTVNKVVERTIERVVNSPATSTTVVNTTENRTVNVTLEEQSVKAVENGVKSLVRIYSVNSSIYHGASALTAVGGDSSAYVGLGLLLNKNGAVVVDKGLLQYGDDVKYVAVYATSTNKVNVSDVVPLKKSSTLNDTSSGNTDADSGFTYFEPLDSATSSKTKINKYIFDPHIGDSSSLKLAQSVYSISGKENNIIFPGIIQSIDTEKVSTTTEAISKIVINVNPSNSPVGAILIDTAGNVIGVRSSRQYSELTNTFIPVNLLKK